MEETAKLEILRRVASDERAAFNVEDLFAGADRTVILEVCEQWADDGLAIVVHDYVAGFGAVVQSLFLTVEGENFIATYG